MRTPSELQYGALREVWRHARGREHCRGEPGSALLGGYAPVLATAKGGLIGAEPLCAKIKDANREVFEGKTNV